MKKRTYMTPEYEQKISELYNQGYTALDMSKELPFCASTLSRYIKKHGWERSPNIRCPVALREQIVEDYKNGDTIEELAKKYPQFTEGWINWLLRKREVTRPNGCQATLNCDYFEDIDTEAKAYFLGLIFADGSISKKGVRSYHNTSLHLSQVFENKYLLEELTKELGSDLPVKVHVRKKNGRADQKMARVDFHSEKLCDDLLKLGMSVNRQEQDIRMPALNPDLMPHFIRGYFDGNGSVFLTKNKEGKIGIASNFVGAKSFLSEILGILDPYLKKTHNLRMHVFDRGCFGSIHFSLTNTRNLYRYMYKSNPKFYLKRKKEKFEALGDIDLKNFEK